MESAKNSSEVVVIAHGTLLDRKIMRKVGKNKNIVKLHKPVCGNSYRVQLCWKQDKSNKFAKYSSDLPYSYTHNNEKEKLILWHAEQFRLQISSKYLKRAPILIAAKNESEIQKLVCTFLRPTCLPYPEVGDWQGIAKFLADHVSLEPLLEKPTQLNDVETSDVYKVQPRKTFESRYLKSMDEQAQQKLQEQLERERETHRRNIEEEERLPPDELHGRRVHCWVLVLPGEYRNDVGEPFYLEPASGIAFDLNDNNHMGVECVWNHQNYWFNKQDNLIPKEYDLNDKNLWIPLIDEEKYKNLDMPSSWMEPINISLEAYQTRYPGGSKTIFYKRAKLELFAELSRPDGLISRVTQFSDLEWTDALHQTSVYKHRKDALLTSQVNLKSQQVTDMYGEGRIDHVKEHEYFLSGNEERKIFFYYESHPAGLTSWHVQSNRVIELYNGHSDRLCQRDMCFTTNDGPVEVTIEDFLRNEDLSILQKQIAKRKFFHLENKIFLNFHHSPDQITAGYLHFLKPSEGSKFGVEHIHEYEPYNPDIIQDDGECIKLMIQNQIEAEEKVIIYAGQIYSQIQNLLMRLIRDREVPGLHTSVFDEQRNHELVNLMQQREQEEQEQSMKELIDPIDLLAPLLERKGNIDYLTPKELNTLKEECETEIRIYSTMMQDALNAELIELQTQLKQKELNEEEQKYIDLKIQAIHYRLKRLNKSDM